MYFRGPTVGSCTFSPCLHEDSSVLKSTPVLIGADQQGGIELESHHFILKASLMSKKLFNSYRSPRSDKSTICKHSLSHNKSKLDMGIYEKYALR